METKKPTPFWLRLLLIAVFVIAGTFLTVFVFLPLVVYLLIPNVAELFPEGRTDLAVWLLLAFFAALFGWAVSLFPRKKHRFFAVFLALLAVFSAIKSLPYFHLDDPDPRVQPVLAASFRAEENQIVPQIYWSSFFVGSSMCSESFAGANLDLSEADQAALNALISDKRYTWIVTGEPLRAVSWSCRRFTQYFLLPWQTSAVYPVEFETAPGEENTVYVYRIPLVPIDNIF